MSGICCEVCGNTELIKQDGVFSCTVCGCKYSLEEVRKMVGAGMPAAPAVPAVPAESPVKKWLESARRAADKELWPDVEKYYSMIEQEDPANIEAIFFSGYVGAKQSMVDEDIYKRQAAFKVLNNCIEMMGEKYDPSRKEENREALLRIGHAFSALVTSDYVYTQWKNGYGIVTRTNKAETSNLLAGSVNQFRGAMGKIVQQGNIAAAHVALVEALTAAVATGHYFTSTNMEAVLAEERVVADRIAEEERNQRMEAYWAAHPEEKQRLEQELAEVDQKISALKEEESEATKEIAPAVRALRGADREITPEQEAFLRAQEELRELKNRRENLGAFKKKEKQALDAEISAKSDELTALRAKAGEAESAKSKEIKAKIEEMEAPLKQLRAQIAELKQRRLDVANELKKER